MTKWKMGWRTTVRRQGRVLISSPFTLPLSCLSFPFYYFSFLFLRFLFILVIVIIVVRGLASISTTAAAFSVVSISAVASAVVPW